MKVLGILVMVAGFASFALATPAVAAPEIDSNSAYTAITLLSGGLMVMRARRKK
jgi:hypothetical protein